MHQLIALAGLPLVLAVVTTGIGLLAEWIVRARLPNGLLAPLGFCAATSLSLAMFELGIGLTATAGLLVAGAVAGFARAGPELRARLNPGWPGLAALAVYGLYAAPVLLSGNWTWSGYNFLNDTAVQFLLIEQLKDFGTDVGPLPLSTGGETTRAYLASGYPIGTHAFAATLAGLLASPAEVVYQPFVAAMAALAAMALAVVAARTLFGPRLGALVGAVAIGSNLTYNFGLQGSIKEIGVVVTLATAAALGRELVRAADPVPTAAALGIALASIMSVYSAAGVPYVAAFLATLALVAVLVHRAGVLRRRWLAAGATLLAVALALSAPVIAGYVDFYRVASAVVDAAAPLGATLGQLAYPLPLLQAGGVWLDGSYQEPIFPSADARLATDVALWTVAALALGGILEVARRRCPELLVVLVPPVLTAALVAPGVVPYADAKLLAIMSPSIVFAAAIGLRALARFRMTGTVASVALAGALTGAVVLSDAYALHDSKIAPRDRMLALREVGERLAGRGPVLFTESEEFAKHFAAAATLNVGVDTITPRHVQLRRPRGIFGRYFDLDEQRLDYVESFPNIVLRRSPSTSRPPARYRRVFANRYYEAWTRGPAPATLTHLPLQRLDRATAPAPCRAVRGLARGAPAGDVALVAAHGPLVARLDVVTAERSPSFPPDQSVPGAVTTITPGWARGPVRIPRAGSYSIWVRGSFPRAAQVLVDGRRRATVTGANTAGQWLGDVPVRLGAGTHRVEVRVGFGSPVPGDGAAVTIGPVAFVADEPRRLEIVPLARWRSLCGRELDWIELVRRG